MQRVLDNKVDSIQLLVSVIGCRCSDSAQPAPPSESQICVGHLGFNAFGSCCVFPHLDLRTLWQQMGVLLLLEFLFWLVLI